MARRYSRCSVLPLSVFLFVWPAFARTQPFDLPVTVDPSWADPEAVAVGDVDGDGRLDVVAAGSAGVAWWREQMGVYTKTTVDGTAALDLDLRDLDADGDLDLAIATGSSLLLAKSSAAGATWTLSTVQATVAARSVEIADIDGDGKLDVLAAFTGGVDWWRNTAGDGSAFSRTTIGALTSGTSAATGDFDRDGDLDVLSTADGAADRLRYWDNLLGAGASWSGSDVALGQDGARSAVVADFDGDGWLDAAAALLDAGEVRVYRNDHSPGNGLWPATLAAAAAGARRLEVGDLDLDADTDLVVAGADQIDFIERLAAAPLSFATRFLAAPQEARVSALGDFDGDGDVDLIHGGAFDDDLIFLPNQSMRRNYLARAQQDIETVDGARAVAAGDLDNDGDIDLAVAAYAANQVRWEENTPAGWLPRNFPNPDQVLNGAFGVTLADLDTDGDLDIVAAGETAGEVAVWINGWPLVNSFTRASIGALPGARGVAVGDTNGDGIPDVVAAGISDDLALFTNDGAPPFPRTFITTTFNRAQAVDLADIDGDGDLDVLAAGNTADEIAWWQNSAGGTVWTKKVISGATLDGAYSVHAADLDRDGDIDAISTAELADKISFWSNDGPGDGLSWTEHSLGFFNQAESADVADFDGDGDLDIVGAAFKDGGRLAFFRNNDGVGNSWTKNEITITFDGAGSVAVADFNRDGLPDFAATAETVDKVAVWLNGGGQYALATTVLSGPSLPAGSETALFRLLLTPRGLVTDNEVELAQLELLLEEAPGDPLSALEADALLEQIEILRDNPGGGTPGVLDGTDISLATLSSFALSPSGVVVVPIADGTAFAEVAQGQSGTFFVTVTTAPSYASLAIADLRVTHVTEGSSRAEDLGYDTELRQEWAANGVTALFPINTFANLAVDVADNLDPVLAGNNLTYTVAVTNHGPDVATGVVLTSSLPAGATLVSTTGCAEDPAGAPSCTLGSINVAATVPVTIVVAVAGNAAGTLSYGAQVGGTLFDPTLANNAATEITAVTAAADLAIEISSPMADYAILSPLPWLVTVSNNGPGPATGATVAVDLPAALTGVFWTCSAAGGASCGAASGAGDIAGQVVNLPAGGSLLYRYRSQVPSGSAPMTATAAVAVGPATADAVAANNNDGVTVPWGNRVFYDGFESGNTAAWSLTLP